MIRKGRENDVHSTWELHAPIAVEVNLVNRVTVNRNNGSSDSPSVLTIPAAFTIFARRRGVWTVRSFGAISSASLSMTDTGTPEFVNRIYIQEICQDKGRRVKPERTAQGASGVHGRTNLPARCGKLDSALLSATLNLSISNISGITWAVGTYPTTGS